MIALIWYLLGFLPSPSTKVSPGYMVLDLCSRCGEVGHVAEGCPC